MEGPYSGSERPHFGLDCPHVRFAGRHTPCEGLHVRIASCHTPCEGPHVRITNRHTPCEGLHARVASRQSLHTPCEGSRLHRQSPYAMRGFVRPHRQSQHWSTAYYNTSSSFSIFCHPDIIIVAIYHVYLLIKFYFSFPLMCLK